MLKCTMRKSTAMRGMASRQLICLSARSIRKTFLANLGGAGTASGKCVPNGVDYVAHVSVIHPGVKRKREQAVVNFFCNWELFAAVPITVAIERVPMQGNEMNAGTDVASTQLFNESRPSPR